LEDIRLQVAVICLSKNEASIVRRQLRSNDEMHAKVNLVVKPIDELQPEWFDVVILSTIVDDYAEIHYIKDNNINAALTCARYAPRIYLFLATEPSVDTKFFLF
jgi:hypothetical protein